MTVLGTLPDNFLDILSTAGKIRGLADNVKNFHGQRISQAPVKLNTFEIFIQALEIRQGIDLDDMVSWLFIWMDLN